jgi:peptidoglycan DL-endopeptidase CwlO
VPILVTLLVVAGTAAGAVLATAGGRPAGEAGSRPVVPVVPAVPSTRPAPARSASPVVPLLGGSAEVGRAVPVATVTPPASAGSPAGGSSGVVPPKRVLGGWVPPERKGNTAPPAKVAPLRALQQADLLVVAPFSLPERVLTTVSRQPGVTSADRIEAAKIKINGTYTAVLGVDPSTFRGYAAGPTAASDPLWQGVADGGVAVSYTMGTLDRLSLGGGITVNGLRAERLRVVAFGTVGIGGVDAVVSDSTAASLGMPSGNAIVISAPRASVASLATLIKGVLPRGAAVEPLLTLVTTPTDAGVSPTAAAGAGTMTAGQLTTALRAAESRQGLPYAWGAAGPSAFDCSGLVQWSFAQAGVRMPRVAADQARTGPAVPVTQLEPGDLLFYHTDPTAPGYISHVAIYLGNGWMIQAPQPGEHVEVVPANFGSEFAGAIRVSPQLAAEVAAGLA